jgi:hypothetical protein
MKGRRPGTATVWLKIALIGMAATAALAPLPRGLVEEWFSTGFYPRLQRAVTPVSNVLPLAWLDVLSVVAIAWVLSTWWRALGAGRPGRVVRIARALFAMTVALAGVYLLFLLIWGFNYRRLPMSARLTLSSTTPTTEAVASLAQDVAVRLNGMYAPAHNYGFREAAWMNPRMKEAFTEVQSLLADAPPAVPGRMKASIFGPFFRWTAVDGMINPFGLEVLANPDLLPIEQPFVAAHEWAHLAGYADESEANFVGWLTCIRADPASQYSGWLYLYWQIAGELPPAERSKIAETLTAGPRDDLSAIAARLRRGDLPALRRASWMMYDRYLKANRVEAGVRSYGDVVTLILRARFEDGWRPVVAVR